MAQETPEMVNAPPRDSSKADSYFVDSRGPSGAPTRKPSKTQSFFSDTSAYLSPPLPIYARPTSSSSVSSTHDDHRPSSSSGRPSSGKRQSSGSTDPVAAMTVVNEARARRLSQSNLSSSSMRSNSMRTQLSPYAPSAGDNSSYFDTFEYDLPSTSESPYLPSSANLSDDRRLSSSASRRQRMDSSDLQSTILHPLNEGQPQEFDAWYSRGPRSHSLREPMWSNSPPQTAQPKQRSATTFLDVNDAAHMLGGMHVKAGRDDSRRDATEHDPQDVSLGRSLSQGSHTHRYSEEEGISFLDSSAADKSLTNLTFGQGFTLTTYYAREGNLDCLLPLRSGDAQLHAGCHVGNYTINKWLGHGAFSQVALGILSGEDVDDASEDEMFKSPGSVSSESGSSSSSSSTGSVNLMRRPKAHGRRHHSTGMSLEDNNSVLGSQKVAIKLLRHSVYEANAPQSHAIAIAHEVYLLKYLHHPCLMTLHDAFRTTTHSVIVLEYVQGGELLHFLDKWHHAISDRFARRVFGELCDLTSWLHSVGIVHRDLKLENVLLDVPISDLVSLAMDFPAEDSNLPPIVKLGDFGLAHYVSNFERPLRRRCGSEAYAAPEVIMGKPYDGRKTDAWALGIILFAILTGGLPFVQSGDKRHQFLLRIAKAEYMWPDESFSHALNRRERANSGASSVSSITLAVEKSAQCRSSQLDMQPESPSSALNASMTFQQATRLATPEARQVVDALLNRRPDKRADVGMVWLLPWMNGPGRAPHRSGFNSFPN